MPDPSRKYRSIQGGIDPSFLRPVGEKVDRKKCECGGTYLHDWEWGRGPMEKCDNCGAIWGRVKIQNPVTPTKVLEGWYLWSKKYQAPVQSMLEEAMDIATATVPFKWIAVSRTRVGAKKGKNGDPKTKLALFSSPGLAKLARDAVVKHIQRAQANDLEIRELWSE